jgi:hypothetical protein
MIGIGRSSEGFHTSSWCGIRRSPSFLGDVLRVSNWAYTDRVIVVTYQAVLTWSLYPWKENESSAPVEPTGDGHSVTARGEPDSPIFIIPTSLITSEAMQHVDSMLRRSASNALTLRVTMSRGLLYFKFRHSPFPFLFPRPRLHTRTGFTPSSQQRRTSHCETRP